MKQKIHPVSHFRGTIGQVPPDKSIAHRAAMFAALAERESVISNFPDAADPLSTVSCLQALGVGIERDGNTLKVKGVGRTGWKSAQGLVDCGNSGTTMRLLAGIAAGAGLHVTLTGDGSLRSRPMKRIIAPLEQMGAQIKPAANNCAPLEVLPNHPLQAIGYELPIASAQVKSCVLLAGLFAEGETVVIEKTPSRDHTERMLGLEASILPDGSRAIKSSRESIITKKNIRIPGDISGAAFWMVAGAIHPGSEITLRDVGMNPTRNAVIGILERMGADIEIHDIRNEGYPEPVADLTVRGAELKAVDLHPEEIPIAIDEIPVIAVAMAFANGVSTVRNADELRAKETDRIRAVVDMLGRAGIECLEFGDGFQVQGNPGHCPKPAEYESWHDHRIAMASAVLASKGEGISMINGADAASVSYPMFWEHFRSLAKDQ